MRSCKIFYIQGLQNSINILNLSLKLAHSLKHLMIFGLALLKIMSHFPVCITHLKYLVFISWFWLFKAAHFPTFSFLGHTLLIYSDIFSWLYIRVSLFLTRIKLNIFRFLWVMYTYWNIYQICSSDVNCSNILKLCSINARLLIYFQTFG